VTQFLQPIQPRLRYIAGMAPPGWEPLGVTVSRFAYYKLIGAKETRFYTFELTSDGKVASYQSSEQ